MPEDTHVWQDWCQNLITEVTSHFYINKIGYTFIMDHPSSSEYFNSTFITDRPSSSEYSNTTVLPKSDILSF